MSSRSSGCKDPDRLRAVVDALAAGGVRALEVTMTVPRAIELIREIAPTLPAGIPVRRGHRARCRDGRTARSTPGARFIVSPVFRRSVIDACHAARCAGDAGLLDPTEILDAWEAGADIVKVFPATTFGPGYIKDVRAPLPHVKLMPTGGVTLDNAGDWIRAGAVAVGVGSALVDAAADCGGQLSRDRGHARRIVANVQAARGH